MGLAGLVLTMLEAYWWASLTWKMNETWKKISICKSTCREIKVPVSKCASVHRFLLLHHLHFTYKEMEINSMWVSTSERKPQQINWFNSKIPRELKANTISWPKHTRAYTHSFHTKPIFQHVNSGTDTLFQPGIYAYLYMQKLIWKKREKSYDILSICEISSCTVRRVYGGVYVCVCVCGTFGHIPMREKETDNAKCTFEAAPEIALYFSLCSLLLVCEQIVLLLPQLSLFL